MGDIYNYSGWAFEAVCYGMVILKAVVTEKNGSGSLTVLPEELFLEGDPSINLVIPLDMQARIIVGLDRPDILVPFPFTVTFR